MTNNLPAAIAAAREALAKYGKNTPRLDTAMGCAGKLRNLLAALDATPQAPPVEWFERWIRNNYQNHPNAAHGITKKEA